MNTKLGTEAKKWLKKYFFKLLKNAVFENTVEIVRKHRDIKLLKINKKIVNRRVNRRV